jgi:hypothetical protein
VKHSFIPGRALALVSKTDAHPIAQVQDHNSRYSEEETSKETIRYLLAKLSHHFGRNFTWGCGLLLAGSFKNTRTTGTLPFEETGATTRTTFHSLPLRLITLPMAGVSLPPVRSSSKSWNRSFPLYW